MVDDLEAKAKAGEQISLAEMADAIRIDKLRGKVKDNGEKPSIRAQLRSDKEKAAPKKAATKTKNNDLEV